VACTLAVWDSNLKKKARNGSLKASSGRNGLHPQGVGFEIKEKSS
jgi:hypothetical protein